jgi:hypothetical protein
MLFKTRQLILLQLLVFAASTSSYSEVAKPMSYRVQRAETGFSLADKWDQGQWAKTERLQLANFMGSRPDHFPATQVKLLHDDENIYVCFRVEDRYVRAVAEEYHDSVCQDSCAEFFFTCGTDLTEGYFNLELNCGGTLLFYHQTARGKNERQVTIEDCKRIRILPSLPKRVDPEIAEPTVWTVKYALPVDILKKYAPLERPGPGVTWKANFYKCADKTSHPHWLTWNPVDNPSPDFHLPQYFGTLVFE